MDDGLQDALNSDFSLSDDEFNRLAFGIAYGELSPEQETRFKEILQQDPKMHETIRVRALTIDKNEFGSVEEALAAHRKEMEDLRRRAENTQLPDWLRDTLGEP